MWSESCHPLSLESQLNEELSTIQRIDALLTLAHFYIFDQSSDQYIEELESLFIEPSVTELQRAHLKFLKGLKRQMVGDWDESTTLLESALDIYKANNHVRGEVEAIIGIAVMHSMSEPSQGIMLLEQAREKIERFDLPLICTAYMLNQFAVAHITVELYSLAEAYARQAQDCVARLPMRQDNIIAKNVTRSYVASAWSLSFSVLLQGKYGEAIQIAEQGLSVVKAANVPYWVARMMEIIGRALVENGDTMAAIERLSDFLDSSPPDGASIYDNCYALLGIAYAEKNQYAIAEPLLLRAVKIYDEVGRGGLIHLRCLKCLANFAKRQERFEDAVMYLEKSEKMLARYKRRKSVLTLEHLTEVHNYKLKQREADFLKSSNEKLAEANQLLQDALDGQSELIKLVAHDVYSPVMSIMLRTNLMMQHIQTERIDKLAEAVTAIRNSADYINDIVFHFQTVDQLENEELQFERKAILIEEEILSAIERNQPSAVEKQVEVRFDHTESLQVCAYETGLKQVLDNILSNAVKYSYPNSTVQIGVSRLDNNRVKIECIDQGVGIDALESHKLFSRFGRLKSSRPTSDERSTGLGLYIVRQLLHRMNGEVVIHSDGIDKGTTISICLPLAESEQAYNIHS